MRWHVLPLRVRVLLPPDLLLVPDRGPVGLRHLPAGCAEVAHHVRVGTQSRSDDPGLDRFPEPTALVGERPAVKRMLAKVRVCSLGESLGGVETLISHPATMTHAALGEKGRKTIGITDGMVRISVGIEDVEDIIDDLDKALAAI